MTRITISGDIIKKSLQVLGYVQFGKVIEYKATESENLSSHAMALYLECVTKKFYDAGGFENFPEVDGEKISTPVYVAPTKVLQKSFTPEEEKYIFPILTDNLKARLKNLYFAEPRFVELKKINQFSYDVTEFLKPAQEVGAKFILVQLLRAQTVKDSQQRERRVTLDEMIFDSSGSLVSMQTAGPTTKDLTVIETAAFAQESLREKREKIFTEK